MNDAAGTPVPPSVTTPDGLVIFPSQLYKGLAKLSSDHIHLPADSIDHALVYDPLTGLMESVRAPGFDVRLLPDDAAKLAGALSFAGYGDWQLPDVPEGVHSVDYTCEDPAADLSLYPDAVSGGYWTRQQTKWSLNEAGSSRSFFYVSVHLGSVSYGSADFQLRARPVRRAAPASQCLVIGQ
ncbi:hypothetical protein B0E46_15655 [Rhodanobacter sp. B04]|uniref:Lcl C-terminal domain-containing protein n=1 Tax=Rhodanobacter sp. B04 TaxID=1945860 RepID=UPI000984494C|nr:DUF1566 domain-containing protein [Rhodanobacter sp. B04]OOG61413.1 hypothetical protein B0E46_15655 [Rhodanobacter sp. B04]